jgi:hypothetical protein
VINYDHEFDDFIASMKEVTKHLKKMNIAQLDMRWQFDHPEYETFVREMNEATEGWISSHC